MEELIKFLTMFVSSGFEQVILNLSLILKALLVIPGVWAVSTLCINCRAYYKFWRIREKKLNQIHTTKGKLLQKLTGLKKPMASRDTLTALSFAQLQGRLRDDSLQVVDLLEAYQAKALEVDRSLNCLTDMVYDADVTAHYLDSLPREHRGRLHGIPLSVKENICLADFDCYYGCVSNCFSPQSDSAPAVEALEKEGMIPFARTTMSQGGMSIGCSSPLFGETLNPHDRARTPGGSSGGEGALIAGRGSMAGLGTDIAGSVRIPASHCGIFAFKPTCERTGRRNSPAWRHRARALGYRGQVGPMASDLDLLVEMTRVLFSPALFEVDDKVPRLPFDAEAFQSERPMRIGFFSAFSDTRLAIDSVPAVTRAVRLAKAALERRGHTLVEWEPPRIGYGCELLVRCLFPDHHCYTRLYREEMLATPALRKLMWFTAMRPALKKVAAAYCWLRDPILARLMLKSGAATSPFDLMMLTDEADAYRAECGKAWNDAGLDGLICPVLPFSAPLVGDVENLQHGALFCNLFNFLDYPAGAVPITRVNEEDVAQLKENYPRRYSHQRLVVETQKDSVGTPVGVQCVTKTWQDEAALRLMREVTMGLQA